MFQPHLEKLPRSELRRLQDRRLRSQVGRLYRTVDFYRDFLQRSDLTPSDVLSVEDLPRLPFIRKEDLRRHYPFGLLAVERSRLRRIHASSGTTGKPVVAGYSKSDLEMFAQVNARSLAAAGAEPGMMLHNAYGYGLFTGGLGLHGGAELLGLTVVPVSGGMTARQVDLIEDFQPDLICCTPSYAQTLAEECDRRGLEPQQISLRYALLGAEPWSEAIRREVDGRLGVKSTNIYGLTEIIGPGVSQECLEERRGSHIWEDHFYPEIVDPASGEPLGDGEEGVLVLTTLTKQAMPLLRYWTGDITSLSDAPCRCGRTHRRMAAIRGRSDDMLIIRGVNLYPSQVEEILLRFAEALPHWQLVVSRKGGRQEIELKVESGLKAKSASELEKRIQTALKERLGLRFQVTACPPGDLPRSEGGKLRRVIENLK